MSISIEPNKGLRLKLDRFSPIRTWHGGGNLWAHEFQSTVRQGALAAFLPKAVEDGESVLFELRSGGGEVASTSTAISSVSEIPTAQLDALRAALTELKNKAEDPHCDRTKRQIIQGFRLPDPQTDRDLYRLAGTGADRRLIVLWGVERVEGSALDPITAVDLMQTSPAPVSMPSSESKSKLAPVLVTLGIVAAALGAGAYFGVFSKANLSDKNAASSEVAPTGSKDAGTSPSSGLVSASTSQSSGVDSSTAKAAQSSASQPQSSGTLSQGSLASSGTATSALSGRAVGITGGSENTSQTGEVKGGTISSGTGKAVVEGSVAAVASGTFGSAAGTQTSGAAVASGTVKTGSLASVAASSTASASTSSGTSSSHGSTLASGTGKSTVASGSSSVVSSGSQTGKDVAAAASTAPWKTAGGSLSATSPGKGPGKDGAKLPAASIAGGSGSAVSAGTSSTSGSGTIASSGTSASMPANAAASDQKSVADKQRNGVRKVESKAVSQNTGTTAPDVRPTAPPVPESTLMKPNGPPPAGISSMTIVSTSLSKTLADGKVEVLLNIVARTDRGMVGDAPPISEWQVDGVVQSRPDGKVAEGPVLPVTIAPGKHTITTIGRGADGKPYRTDADVVIRPQE